MLNILLSAIKIVFLLGFLIFIHEFGHFIVAKLFKVKVKEFAIGFGKILWQKQGEETKYVLRLIPLGGFVNLLGEEESSDDEGSFSKAKQWKKILILLAGGTVNIIFGLVVYFLLITNMGNFISTTIDEIVPNTVAEEIGLQSGDVLIKINNKKIRLKSDIDKLMTKGDELVLSVKRNNELLELNVTPQKDIESGRYMLGIRFRLASNDFKTNLYYGFWDTVNFTNSLVQNVKEIFTGNVGVNELSGPVGISEIVVKTENTIQFVYVLALISLSLGVTNLLPFPPLDGGKILLLLIEAATRKPIKENVNNAIQMIGFLLIMILAVVVTYNDILKLF